MSKIIDFLHNGNNCDHCPCAWSEYSEGCGEWDGGCHIRDDDEICRLPLFIRKLKLRRANYLMNHEYDDLYDWVIKEEKITQSIRDEISEILNNYYICWKDKEDVLHECDKYDMVHTMSWRAKYAYDDANPRNRKNLRVQWMKLFLDTIKVPINYIKSYILGKRG